MLLYLSDLFHSFLQNCTFVRFDIEVVDVVEVGEDQLSELFDVFVLMLTVSLLVAPLWTAETKSKLLGLGKYMERRVIEMGLQSLIRKV